MISRIWHVPRSNLWKTTLKYEEDKTFNYVKNNYVENGRFQLMKVYVYSDPFFKLRAASPSP